MEYYLYVTSAGVPETGLSPSWETLTDSGGACGGASETGVDQSGDAPTIYEVGGGFYKFDITFGVAPWATMTRELLGVIDLGSSLADTDRYKPVVITKRGLALAMLIHRGVQSKTTGDVTVYASDGSTAEAIMDMTDASGMLTRDLTVAD